MASGDTKTEALLNILGSGGDASEYRGCCNTKSQSYILDAIDRVQKVEDDVEEIKNNPDVVDIVATYADLQAYDTQHLTDRDIIRVLQDETHDGESTYYRYNKQSDTWTYIGESKQYDDFVGTDGQTAGEAGLVPAPATTDAGKFLKADGTWAEAAGGGGGAIELTSADYDYPDANPTGVALWRLPAGMYWTKQGVRVFYSTSDNTTSEQTVIISNSDYNYYTDILRIYSAGGENTYLAFKTIKATGVADSTYNNKSVLLSNRISQSTGTSTSDVMSQNAVSSMVFADPSSQTQVQIGYSAAATGTNGPVAIGQSAAATLTGAVALGRDAHAYGQNSIALGRSSYASAKGEFNVGATNSTYGYNSSEYRLLSGLYDGQTAHDAATVGQINATIDAINTALSTNIPHIGA